MKFSLSLCFFLYQAATYQASPVPEPDASYIQMTEETAMDFTTEESSGTEAVTDPNPTSLGAVVKRDRRTICLFNKVFFPHGTGWVSEKCWGKEEIERRKGKKIESGPPPVRPLPRPSTTTEAVSVDTNYEIELYKENVRKNSHPKGNVEISNIEDNPAKYGRLYFNEKDIVLFEPLDKETYDRAWKTFTATMGSLKPRYYYFHWNELKGEYQYDGYNWF